MLRYFSNKNVLRFPSFIENIFRGKCKSNFHSQKIKMPSKNYDPNMSPKYCPDCEQSGVRRKVKTYSINLEGEVRTDMWRWRSHVTCRPSRCARIPPVPGHSMNSPQTTLSLKNNSISIDYVMFHLDTN